MMGREEGDTVKLFLRQVPCVRCLRTVVITCCQQERTKDEYDIPNLPHIHSSDSSYNQTPSGNACRHPTGGKGALSMSGDCLHASHNSPENSGDNDGTASAALLLPDDTTQRLELCLQALALHKIHVPDGWKYYRDNGGRTFAPRRRHLRPSEAAPSTLGGGTFNQQPP